MSAKFYICKKCGNLAGMINSSGVPMVCCGEKMTALEPNTTDAAGEKHVPVVTLKEGAVYVNVGAVTHPMSKEHSIEWIYLETDKGGHRAALLPDETPEATFCIKGEEPKAVYAYCNLHGLWMTEI